MSYEPRKPADEKELGGGGERKRIQAYREAGDATTAPRMVETQDETIDEDIIVSFKGYHGEGSDYTNWTLMADVWIDKDGDRKHEKYMKMGVNKSEDITEEYLEEKFREEYKQQLLEDKECDIAGRTEDRPEKKVLDQLVEKGPETTNTGLEKPNKEEVEDLDT